MKKTSAALLQAMFFESPIPMCLFAELSESIEIANNAFFKLTGYTRENFKEKNLQDLIYKKDFSKIAKRMERLEEDNCIYQELQVIAKGKSCKDVEITIGKVTGDNEVYFFCIFYDISWLKENERALNSQIQEEKEKTLITVKGIIRNKQLLDKWHIAPSFLRDLWKCKDEDSMLQKSIHLMCHSSGFKYAAATILLKEEDHLQVKFASKTQPLQKFHIQKQHKFAQVFRGEKKIMEQETGEFTVPITSPIQTEGILQIFLNEKERALLEDNEKLCQSHLDFIECQALLIGIMLYSLRNAFYLEPQHFQGMLTLKKEIETKVEINEDFCIMQIRWDNFYECLVSHTEKLESLRKEVAQNILSFKPTSSSLFYVGDHDFFLLVPGNLLRSEGGEAEKMRRKLSQAIYSEDENLRLTVSIGVIKSTSDSHYDEQQLLNFALLCIKEAQKKGGNCVYVWDNKPIEVPQGVTRKLQ